MPTNSTASVQKGESGFEEALLNAVAKDETPLHQDPLILAGLELGGVLVEEEAPREPILIAKYTPSQDTERLARYVGRYLDSAHLVHDDAKRAKLQAKLLTALTDGVQDDDGTYSVVGLRDPDFMKYPVHADTLIRYVRRWLKQNRFVFMGCEDETAAKIVDLAQQALGLKPIQTDVFQAMQDARDEELQEQLPAQVHQPTRRKKVDLLAVPDESSEATAPKRPLASKRRQEEAEPVQLAMF